MTPQLIELEKTVLCADCNRISESTGNTCVGCDSTAIVNVARILPGGSPMLERLERMVDEGLREKEEIA